MQCTLVGGKATAPSTPVATAIATSREAVSATTEAATATAHSTSTATATHAGKVRPLRDHLDVAALEDALIEDQGLWDKVGLGELDVGVTSNEGKISTYYLRGHCKNSWHSAYPLGWPVNLSSRMVTRLIEPQL